MRVELDSLDSPRAEFALDRLRGGDMLSIEDLLSITLTDDRGLEVSVWSRWEPKNAPPGTHQAEAEAGVRSYETLVEQWSALRDLVDGRPPRFSLLYDYGGGAVLLGTIDRDGTYCPVGPE